MLKYSYREIGKHTFEIICKTNSQRRKIKYFEHNLDRLLRLLEEVSKEGIIGGGKSKAIPGG